MTIENCIHIANLFYLASYLCRDILWLRVLTCAGLLFGLIFFSCQSEMLAPATWMGIFLLINCVQIVRTLRERSNIRLSDEQQAFGAQLLQRLSRNGMLNVLTKSMCKSDRRPKLLERSDDIKLDQEERIVRDLAFDRLSNEELMNLITRRFWKTIRRRRTGWLRTVITRS